MTREEKIQAELDSMTREEKIEGMLGEVHQWDLDSLIDWIQFELRWKFRSLSDTDLDQEYFDWFDYKFEDADYDDDEEIESDNVCKCPCTAWGIIHVEDCPERMPCN